MMTAAMAAATKTTATSMTMTKTRWHTNLLGAFAVWRAPYSSLDRSTISFWVNNVDSFFPLFIRAIFIDQRNRRFHFLNYVNTWLDTLTLNLLLLIHIYMYYKHAHLPQPKHLRNLWVKCGEKYFTRRHTFLVSSFGKRKKKTINQRRRKKHDRCIKRFLSIVHTFYCLLCCGQPIGLLILLSGSMNINVYLLAFVWIPHTAYAHAVSSIPSENSVSMGTKTERTKKRKECGIFKCIYFIRI